MTALEQILARAVFESIKRVAKNLNFVDKAVLLGAFNGDQSWAQIPQAQRRLFLTVGMDVVKALQASSGSQGAAE